MEISLQCEYIEENLWTKMHFISSQVKVLEYND